MKFIVRVNVPKPRDWEPIKRSAVFGDKRRKRIKNRNDDVRKAIRESCDACVK
jgi:hypothetical protein